MSGTHSLSTSLIFSAPPERVWKALTDPAEVKRYLFGTDLHTDWQVGHAITYTGVWEGKSYEDRGHVLSFEPYRLIETTYWSAFSGLPDAPENYQKVTYALAPQGQGTKLSITQSGLPSAEACEHSKKNWDGVLAGMKAMIEKP
jgi:uncharacterized protein YndB with AHSA1/START domain